MKRFTEPYELEDERQAKADRGAIHCDSCGGLIRVGEIKYTLDVSGIELTICGDCKAALVGSAAAHGFEDTDYREVI